MARYKYTVKMVSVTVSESNHGPDYDMSLGDPERATKFARAVYSDLDADQEHFSILALDSQHRFCGIKTLSSGTRTQTPVDPARLFRIALEFDAAGIILVHNHPSGNSEPSNDDIELTRRLVSGGKILGIPVYDHIILGDSDISLRRSRPAVFK
jgi:DNA repair protein RadC